MPSISFVKITLCSALFVITTNSSAAVYKWKDDSGLIHYSATRPQGVQYEKMGVSTNALPAAPSAAPKSPKKSASETTADTKNTAKGETKDSYTPEQHATLCNNAKKDVATLNKSGRLRVKQKDGSTAVMSDENRNKRMKTMQSMINKHCK